jgi:dolichyl-phosphate-mannose--protein O-mannosyl transferase
MPFTMTKVVPATMIGPSVLLKCLFLLLGIASRSVSYVSAATDVDAPDDAVTCGSAVKLVHVESSSDKAAYLLNSEQKNLGTGSGQQIVTAVQDPTTTNALWWVRGPNDPEFRGTKGSACSSETSTGQPILCNSYIRLTHLETMRNLHSHNVKSPLSRQQEVVS